MQEGWLNDDYIVLFEPSDADRLAGAYGVDRISNRWRLVGLLNWDDFILTDESGRGFTIPTVPLDKKYLAPYDIPSPAMLRGDSAIQSKIRWHTKPLIFGGDPQSEDNIRWGTRDQHVELVVWWNEKYREAIAAQENH